MAGDQFLDQRVDIGVVGTQALGLLGGEHDVLDLLDFRRRARKPELRIVGIDIRHAPFGNVQIRARLAQLCVAADLVELALARRDRMLVLHHELRHGADGTREPFR